MPFATTTTTTRFRPQVQVQLAHRESRPVSAETRRFTVEATARRSARREGDDQDDDDNTKGTKFGFGQRIESVKCLVLGGLAGGVAATPVTLLHDILSPLPFPPYAMGNEYRNSMAQWEFDTDMAALEAGLFAIVYRYAIRCDTNNPQLNQGVVAAFAVTRTVSRIVVSSQCSAVPLTCEYENGWFFVPRL